jgi:tRNA-uridine 2-sulfurtransferase
MRVLAALSGGVDSSVAVAELLGGGHDVTAVTMRLWGGASDTGCCSVADVEDARRAASQLGVEHHVFDFSDEFRRRVVDPYVTDHAAGRTPNPCVECNRHLKFDVLLERAEVLGFDAVATGHHARLVELPGGGRRVARGADASKDQSYVLHPLGEAQLARVSFPIGHLTKDEVRRRAAALGLRTAAKPDSQDVCFVTRAEGRSGFLASRTSLHTGRVVDVDGTELGEVEAVELVTIGQRRGLALSGGAARRFVVDVDVPSRTVTVGPPERLTVPEQRVGPIGWVGEPVAGEVLVQCSAHGRVAAGEVQPDSDGVVLRWSEPQRRVAPGQSVVLYRRVGDDEVVVGGGPAR